MEKVLDPAAVPGLRRMEVRDPDTCLHRRMVRVLVVVAGNGQRSAP